MKYMCLIYSTEGTAPQPGTEDFGLYMKGYQDFSKDMHANQKLLHADALQPIVTATTVTVRDCKTITTDGPFAETKEQLGGYYLLECTDLDDAIAQAAKIPTASFGRIEIRPVMVWDS